MASAAVELNSPIEATSDTRTTYAMLAVLALVNLCNFTDRVLFSVMLEPMKIELHLSDTQMGLLGGVAFALLYGTTGLIMGRLADTRNRVRVLACAMGLWSAASAMCGVAASFAQMALARAVVGVGVSASGPCGQSLIADYFPPERRSLALSIFAGVGTVGTLIGIVLGGHVAAAFGWRFTFLVFAIPGLLAAPMLFLFGREPSRGAYERSIRPKLAWSDAVRSILAKRSARYLLIGIPLLLTTVGVANWIPAFLQRAHHASAADVGTYGGASLGIGLVLGTFAGGVIVNALIRRNAMWEFWWPALATLISVPLLALFFFAGTAELAYTILFFAFLIAGSSLGPAIACVVSVADAAVRGTMVALAAFTTSVIAYGLVPTFVGVISDVLIANGFGEVGGQSLRFALCATLILPMAGAILFLRASIWARREAAIGREVSR